MIAENNYKVYKHTTPNGKVYIGITCQDPQKRWGYGCNYKNQRYFSTAIKKYGWDNITHEILYDNLSQEEAEDKEVELIAKYKSNNREFGYNIANGGKSRGMVSEETKKRISEFQKGKKPSEYMLQRAREVNTGRICSEETKQKIRNKNLGRKVSDDAKRKMSASHTGKKLSETTKRKLSESVRKSWTEQRRKEFGEKHKGEKCIFYGKKWTPEEILELQIKNRGINSVLSKKVGQFDKEGNLIKIYGSCREAGRAGYKHSAISAVCRGEKHTHKGFVWKYMEGNNAI